MVSDFTITEKTHTRVFPWFTFKALLRHYAEQALTPWQVDVKLGCNANLREPSDTLRFKLQMPHVPELQPGDGQQNNGPMPPINAFYSLLKLSKWECSSIQKRLLKLCWKVKRKGNIYLHCIAAAATAIHWTCNIVTGCDRDITHHI